MNRHHALLASSSMGLLMLAGCSAAGGTNSLPELGCTVDCNGNPKPDAGPGTPAQDAAAPAVDAGAGGSNDASSTTGSATWADGMQLTSSVVIGPGATVTIAPAAKITIGAGVTITVEGTLTASSSSGTHALLESASKWGGIIVAKGGTLSLDGVDLTNAATAIDTQSGNAAAAYDNATITAAGIPFEVEKGSKLTTSHSNVAGTLGTSSVSGSFTASHMDYASNGNEGIATSDPTAALSIEDSTLHGTGPSGDMLVSSGGAATFHVAYSVIKDSHCAFHFDSISSFDISYVTDETNAWGAMLYGSDPAKGPYSITYSNIQGNKSYALDESGSNGTITVDHSYVQGQSNVAGATNPQSAAVSGALPRP